MNTEILKEALKEYPPTERVDIQIPI